MFSWQIWDANLTENSKMGDEFEQWIRQLILFEFIPYLGVVSQICISNLPWKHQQTTRWRLFSRLWYRHYFSLLSWLQYSLVQCTRSWSLHLFTIWMVGLPDIISSKIWPATSSFFLFFLDLYSTKRTIHILCQQKSGWVGLEKGHFCCCSVLTIYIVGGSKKVQNYKVVIHEW